MTIMRITVILGLVLCVLSPQAHSASIYNGRDSYENIPIEPLENNPDNIEDNLIEDEYDSIGKLFPPQANAKDYYSKYYIPKPASENKQQTTEYANKYVIDTANKVLRLKTTDDATTQETKLSQSEEDEIKKLSAAFVELFANSKLDQYDWTSATQNPEKSDENSEKPQDWKSLNPVITLTDDGISIVFVNDSASDNSTEASTEAQTTENEEEETTEISAEEADQIRESLWDFLAKSVDKILTEELEKRSNNTDLTSEGTTDDTVYITEPTNEEVDDDDESTPGMITKFVSSLWNLMKTSVEYVGNLFGGSEDEQTEAPTEISPTSTEGVKPSSTEGVKTSSPSSTTTLFAYEEPARYHRFPSQEFEKRGRDIDAILYGHGIA